MSDLQDVIAAACIRAFNAGVTTGTEVEQKRVIDILTALPSEFTRKEEVERAVATAIKRIGATDE
jgi:hypothetical protein